MVHSTFSLDLPENFKNINQYMYHALKYFSDTRVEGLSDTRVEGLSDTRVEGKMTHLQKLLVNTSLIT